MNTSDCAAVSTACSPLTARLSITMSLYGRRPSVVRSFVIWNSLISTLSSETTSLPIENLSFSRGLETAFAASRPLVGNAAALLYSSSGFHGPACQRQNDHQDLAKSRVPALARANITAILSLPPAAL